MRNKNIKDRYEEDPNQVLIDELLDVVSKTRSPATKLEALQMIMRLQDDHIC